MYLDSLLFCSCLDSLLFCSCCYAPLSVLVSIVRTMYLKCLYYVCVCTMSCLYYVHCVCTTFMCLYYVYHLTTGLLDLDAGRLARRLNPEGPATGHLDPGFLGLSGS